MGEKQILAALEITSHEIRLLVGEYYNTRLNVLRTERVPTKGISGINIDNHKTVVSSIRKAVDQASSEIGTRIERVLLCVPSYRVKKEKVNISKKIDNYDRRITLDDMQTLSKRGYQMESTSDLTLVNWMNVKYLVDNIYTRAIPVGEPCSMLSADMDLFFADKITTYDYAQLVEDSGLEIIDICLNSYAACKEASIFEQSVSQNIISIQIEAEQTTLTVIAGSRIETTKSINSGYNDLVKALMSKYDVPTVTAKKLVLQNLDLGVVKPADSPVYMWTKNEESLIITEKELYDIVTKVVHGWVNELADICGPILEIGNVKVLISGEGAELDGLDKFIGDAFNCKAMIYYPDIIGARSSMWTVCLGMIYGFIDQLPLYRNKKMSINQASFIESIRKRVRQEEPDDNLTKRLKSFFSKPEK